MKYTDMVARLDKDCEYKEYDAKPMKKLNEVWKIHFITTRENKVITVYKPTAKTAETEAKKVIKRYIHDIIVRNTYKRERREKENKEWVEKERSFIWSEEVIDEEMIYIEKIIIEATDKNNNTKTITIM